MLVVSPLSNNQQHNLKDRWFIMPVNKMSLAMISQSLPKHNISLVHHVFHSRRQLKRKADTKMRNNSDFGSHLSWKLG